MIRVGMVGFGNVGKGVALAVKNSSDMQLVGIFTRRNPLLLKREYDYPIYGVSEIEKFENEIDVLVLCLGSAKDLPEVVVKYVQKFNTVDSFDNHKSMLKYYAKIDETAKNSEHISVIGAGWDPGLFSVIRLMTREILKEGHGDTFWGKGISQGHSEAIKNIAGVRRAVEYTVPIKRAVRKSEKFGIKLKAEEKHKRICYVVKEVLADKKEIEKGIKNIPDYFSGYITKVKFISEKKFIKKHGKFIHSGVVFRKGNLGVNKNASLKFTAKMDDNPRFTGQILKCYVRAVSRLKAEGKTGAYTALEIPPNYLSYKPITELIEDLL